MIRAALPIRRIAAATAVAAATCSVAAAGALAPGVAAAELPDPDSVRLSITEITPSPVRATGQIESPNPDLDGSDSTFAATASSPIVTVTGTLTNFSAEPVTSLAVRIERGDALLAADDSRTALVDSTGGRFSTVGPFERVADELAPGQTVTFSTEIALGPTEGLHVDHPGVYPILLNLNGIRSDGSESRLDDSRTLLTVASTPGPDPTAAIAPELALSPTVSGQPLRTDPAAITLVWPLAADTRAISNAAATGSAVGESALLQLPNAALLGELQPGGRLAELLATYDGATDSETDTSEVALRNASCLAIDPQLVSMARSLGAGRYTIAGTGGAEHPPVAAATEWLTKLTAVAKRGCSVALPPADVDLDAVGRIDDPTLSSAATIGAADALDRALGVSSVRGVVLPGSGVLTSPAADAIAGSVIRSRTAAPDTHVPADGQPVPAPPGPDNDGPDNDGPGFDGPAVALVSANTVGLEQGPDRHARLGPPDTVVGALVDPYVSAALAALGPIAAQPNGTLDPQAPVAPSTPAATPGAVRFGLSEESEYARRLDATGAISAIALRPTENAVQAGYGYAPAEDPTATELGRSAVLVPPARWAASGADARAVLGTVSELLSDGLGRAVPLSEVAAQARQSTTGASLLDAGGITLSNHVVEPSGRVPADQLESARGINARIGALGLALASTDTSELTPTEFTTALTANLLNALQFGPGRAGSDSRQNPGADVEQVYASTMNGLSLAGGALGAVERRVAIVAPGGGYTLASEKSPLLVVVRNDLPLAVRVRIVADAPVGLSLDDSEVFEVPPRGSRQIQLPGQAHTSARVQVTFALTTESGVTLGDSITVPVHSNAFGKSLFWLTVAAGIALVTLSGRRLWRRFHGQPDPQDIDRPEPSAQQRLQADNYVLHRQSTRRVPPSPPQSPNPTRSPLAGHDKSPTERHPHE